MLIMHDVDSCPRDGTHVVLRGPSGWSSSKHRLDEGYYDSSYPKAPWRDRCGNAWGEGGEDPTHWAPLDQVLLEGQARMGL